MRNSWDGQVFLLDSLQQEQEDNYILAVDSLMVLDIDRGDNIPEVISWADAYHVGDRSTETER